MSATPPSDASNVIKLRSGTKASAEKWGVSVMKLGYSIVPSLILRAQHRLGLKAPQLAVLLQIADYWWDADRKPWPSKETLSVRMGTSPRQIQKIVASLEDKGLIQRIERRDSSHGGKLSNEYDLSGLVKRLQEIAPEVEQVEQEVKAKRRSVSKRNHRRSPKTASK